MRSFLKGIFVVLVWVYYLALFAWLAAYFLRGDGNGTLGLVNLLAVYLFAPLPFALLAALVWRSPASGLAGGVATLAFLYLWGVQFLPRLPHAQAGGPQLTVMTYNVLAYDRTTAPTIAAIRLENPDVVLIQELNNTLAEALQSELIAEYPYQVLNPVNSAMGIGVISKYPIRPTGETMSGAWMGGPLFLDMDWAGQTVRLVDFHMHPTPSARSQAQVAADFRIRDEQARLLADYARRAGPVILGGDANTTSLNEAYHIFTQDLRDAWKEKGFGLGHTFPGSTVPGSDRPKIGPFYVPQWLARIDYIFHSAEWETEAVRVARSYGVSDHRGVIATLRLKP